MNENIRIEEVSSEAGLENVFEVEIENSTEVLIEAHNASEEAHKNTLGALCERTDALSNIVDELEDNMVLKSDIPRKISELENDINLVSEETVARALEVRQIVNQATLNETLGGLRSELNQTITSNTEIINNNITSLQENVSVSTNPKNIAHCSLPNATTIVNLTLPADGATLTAPEDGVISVDFLPVYNDYGYVYLLRSGNTRVGDCTHGQSIGFEMFVNKGEVLTMERTNSRNGYNSRIVFYYLNGTKPEA